MGGLEAEREERELWQSRERRKIQESLDAMAVIKENALKRRRAREQLEKGEQAHITLCLGFLVMSIFTRVVALHFYYCDLPEIPESQNPDLEERELHEKLEQSALVTESSDQITLDHERADASISETSGSSSEQLQTDPSAQEQDLSQQPAPEMEPVLQSAVQTDKTVQSMSAANKALHPEIEDVLPSEEPLKFISEKKPKKKQDVCPWSGSKPEGLLLTAGTGGPVTELVPEDEIETIVLSINVSSPITHEHFHFSLKVTTFLHEVNSKILHRIYQIWRMWTPFPAWRWCFRYGKTANRHSPKDHLLGKQRVKRLRGH